MWNRFKIHVDNLKPPVELSFMRGWIPDQSLICSKFARPTNKKIPFALAGAPPLRQGRSTLQDHWFREPGSPRIEPAKHSGPSRRTKFQGVQRVPPGEGCGRESWPRSSAAAQLLPRSPWTGSASTRSLAAAPRRVLSAGPPRAGASGGKLAAGWGVRHG